MKTKKLKSTKCGSIRRKVPSDVSPTTSLPPLVEGQLRCFLRVTVSRVLWTVPKPFPTTFIRLRWWGESSNGTQFRPRDGSQTTQNTVKSTARFPIRCGPKQFTSYLTDMGSLVLEVLTKPEHLPIARAQVAGISCLSLSHSISGFFTLVSPMSEKLGELQVSLALEALTETYDSSCSVPTTDMSIEMAVPAFRSTVKPASQPNILVVPSLSRPLSVNSGKESGSNTPRGKDHLYFQNAQTEKKTDLALENQKPTSSRSQHGQGAANPTVQESTHGQTTNDILSVLLERGSNLRNAMVVSALKSDMDSELALKDTPLPLPKDNIGAPPMPSIPHCGRLLQNILHADSSLLQSPHTPPDYLSPDCTAADTENRAVDLLLGSLNGSALPIWDGEGSPPDSFLSVYGDSELNDPQYDQSLLENLFYKAPMSNSSPSDDDKDGPSPKKNLKKRGDDKELRHSGPKKSGGLDSENVQTPGTGDMLPGLCMDQLTVLGEVRLARVVIHTLNVPADSATTTPKKTSGKGKPPRPLSSKKFSYFVEYLFPVTSSRHDPSQALAAEVTRVFSSKVTGGVVNFQQRNVFPVHFSGSTIEQWWGTELTFNIYSRNSSQKKPVAIGKAVFPLCCLLQREQLSQTIILPVQSLQGTGESQDIGPLKVSLELAADNKDFSSANGQRSAGAGYRAPSQALTSPQREASPSRVDMTTIRPQHHDTRGEDIPLSTVNNRYSRTGKQTVAPQGPSPLPSLQTSHHRPQAHQVVEEDSGVLLHALLMVPNGKDFSCGPMQPPNVYLNCKLFGQDETSRSVISWGQANPSFNFVQVAPVSLTSRLLERMRNNVMVIEVWQRAGSLGQDRLLGLVKLPLHQFYMSFRDPKISHLLLQAQYPVLGVDSYMPVIDVFSGIINGNLRVLLAMGLSVQIVSLQHMRDEELGSVSHLPRPAHLLDHQPHKVKPSPEETMREHLFVVKVERVKGLTPLQSTVWGEADCYVQYTFPTQEEPPAQSLDPILLNCSVNLRQFRTTTTLCVPDPVFGHSESHVLLAPLEVPVQRLLLSSFSSQGLANGGGIPFEVWCRYYYPNVRDQLVAKGMLPLSKLCAMVTMQRQQPTEAQVFSLPLMPRTDSPAGHQPQPSGLLDVFVHYKQRPLRSDVRSGAVASRVVTMVVQVHRAAGLQAAARALSEQDETFQYYADVGVNVYVTAHLSFLPESERRSTRVAARTFCPEFDHHTEFPCELQVQRSSGETCSLAELLQEATAVFTVWNRDSRKVMVSPRSKNTMLGTVKIQLADLIHKRTGISGWFGVSLPKDLTSSPRHHIFVGGLDISINFAHHADRERVVTAAQGLGWEVGREEEEEEPPNEGEMWAETQRTVSLTMSMPRAWLPVHCLLLPGHSELQRSTYCYFRYKLYDGEAFCSQLRHPGLSVEEEGGGGEEGLATVAFRGSRTVELRSSQPLLWYLREEKLEIQVWVAFGKDRGPRPHDMDRLVGSAFVDLSSLAKMARHKLNLSGVYPLFRRSAPDLSGAALRVHITLTPGSLPEAHTPGGGDSQDQENCDSQGEEEEKEGGQGVPSSTAAVSRQSGAPSRHQTKSSISVEPSQPSEVSMEDTFTVTITVDRAMHLSLKGCPLAERSGGLPSCCVSYITTDSAEPVTTALIADSHCPVWDHQQECRLSKQLLLDPQQSLVFKVWHKGDVERVIGFASVDLSPLLSGFQSVCGWYNITDFNGQCQGQLKVSVSPLKGVQELRGQRQAVCDGNKDSSALFQTLPLYYHTTATYSSFPSHVSRYTEQRINSTPHHLDRLLPERSSESDRHDEHMDRVRLYHQSLQEGGVGHPTSAAALDAHPSSSVLFSALRKNLSELDDIQRYFSHKLSTPTFPSQSEQGQRSRLDEYRVSDTDSSQLLLKSTRLVGEVNNLISGLQRHQRMERISSSPQSSSTTPPVPDDHHLPESYETFPQSAPCFHKASGSPQEDVSPVPSPVPCMYQEHSDSQADEEEEDKDPASEDDEGGGPREEEEDGDYEETVVEPRPLNEVASLTDRTSPWTSLLSDPDLASLESLETPEEHQALDYSYHPRLTQQEGERERSDLQTDTLQAWSSSEPIGSRLEEREQHVNSEFPHGPDTDEEEDMVSDGERTLQTSDNEAALHQESITAALHEQSLLCSGETASKVPGDRDALSEVETSGLLYDTAAFSEEDTEHVVVTSDTYQPETFLHKEDNRKSKHSDPVDIPNFFLSSHHMEASMRALRIAPVFPLASSDPKKSPLSHGILCRRVPRPRPNIPLSSMKKEETKRIAKIFASHFKD